MIVAAAGIGGVSHKVYDVDMIQISQRVAAAMKYNIDFHSTVHDVPECSSLITQPRVAKTCGGVEL